MPKRDRTLTIRLSAAEIAQFEELAAADMRPLSQYLRVVLMERIPAERRRLKLRDPDEE